MTMRSLGFLIALVAALPAVALINPRFTPVDLYREATTMASVIVAAPPDAGQHAAVPCTLGTVLKGQLAAAPALMLGDADPDTARTACAAGTGVLLLGDFSRATGADAGGAQGALYVGRTWFALRGDAGRYTLEDDTLDLGAVWAGSAPMLARLFADLGGDPAMEIPTAAGVTWDRQVAVGRVAGEVYGCEALRLPGQPTPIFLVRAADGDRAFTVDRDGTAHEVTARMGLRVASKQAAWADMDGDGLLDYATRDGTRLAVCFGRADGTLAAPRGELPLAACRGLVAGGQRGAIIAATDAGLQRIAWQGDALVAQELPPPAGEAGEAGPALAADLDGDGWPDLLQAWSTGLVLYRGAADGPAQPVEAAALDLEQPTFLEAIDADADGFLDLLVGDGTTTTLLLNDGHGRFAAAWEDSAELEVHSDNLPGVARAIPCDINNDGRVDVALQSRTGLYLYFNRGYACFGYARELDPARYEQIGAFIAWQGGLRAGTVADVNGDGAEDLIGVDADGTVTAVLRQATDRNLVLRLARPAATQPPLVVRASDGPRALGARLVMPGQPAVFGKRAKGPMTLTWTAPGQAPTTRRVVVTQSTDAAID